MALRHAPRPSDRDTRMLEPSNVTHPHLLNHPAQHPHPAHLNGNPATIATTSGPIPNGPNHSHSNGSSIVPPAPTATAVSNGAAGSGSTIVQKLASANEQTWLLIGRVAEQMGEEDHALTAYENALRHNPMSLSGLTQVAGIARIKENYPRAIDYFQRVLSLQEDNGEVWSALGHCYLMQDDLQKAYSAYQQALYLLPNPKEDPKLWYGIGILYDRYGSLDHAEEAFSSVLRMDKELDFDKANEILFRLGIIYKQQGKYDESLQCFDRILRNPPNPLAHADIWFQIGHVYELQKDHARARDAYERVVADNPSHAKVLQQLGWLYHQDGSSFQDQDLAIQFLTKSLEADSSDAQSWYLLGRAYMAGQKYNKAYEAYQQAVYRDGRNPTFWCSIGVLYFQINQFRDALDAYSRAIRINPYISEVWFDLGSLYESCNNQISDAIDAYARASELGPRNPVITQRLQLLKMAQATGSQLPAAPGPQDVHPTAYASAVVPPPGLTGPPLMLQAGGHRPVFRADSRGPTGDLNLSLPPPSQVGIGRSSPGPFRGGPPPPVILDESRHMPSHTPLAPMDVDRPPVHPRDYHSNGPARDGPARGPGQSLLHHPVPQQLPAEEIRNGSHRQFQEPHYSRSSIRGQPMSVSPPPTPPQNLRNRSPPPPFQNYPPAGRVVGPGQPNQGPPQRSPRVPYAPEPGRAVGGEMGWERRPPPPPEHHRDWDRSERAERRLRHSGDYPHPQPPPFYSSRSPGPQLRGHSPPEHSPRQAPPSRAFWESNSGGAAPSHSSHGRHTSPSLPPRHEPPSRGRYDPRFDRDYESEGPSEARAYVDVPESMRAAAARNPPPSHLTSVNLRGSESPHLAAVGAEQRGQRRRLPKEKELEPQAVVLTPSQQSQEPPVKKEKKKRSGNKRAKEEGGNMSSRTETPKPYPSDVRAPPNMSGSFKLGYNKATSEPSSNGSSRSVRPSPTNGPRPPSRVVDEDYDEGVTGLMSLASGGYAQEMPAPSRDANGVPNHSPTISSVSRPSPRIPSHRNSISSTRSRASPPVQATTLKRPLSRSSDELSDSKRSRMDLMKRRISSPSGGRRTPGPSMTSSRPSPVPFRAQPTSRSPELRQGMGGHPPSPPLLTSLPPHPLPIGTGLPPINNNTSITLPPITILTPPSAGASPGSNTTDRDHDGMMVDQRHSPTPSPVGGRNRQVPERQAASRSPQAKHTPTSPRSAAKSPRGGEKGDN